MPGQRLGEVGTVTRNAGRSAGATRPQGANRDLRGRPFFARTGVANAYRQFEHSGIRGKESDSTVGASQIIGDGSEGRAY